jgi:hypothetical protein
VREFFSYAVSNPHPYNIGQDGTSQETAECLEKEPGLTSGFVAKLSSEFSTLRSLTASQFLPVLKIIEKATTNQKHEFDGETSYLPLTTLMAINGDSSPLLIKCASQLNYHVGNLSIGSVI